MDLGFNLAPSNRDLKDPTSRQNFGDTSGLLCKNDPILRRKELKISCAPAMNIKTCAGLKQRRAVCLITPPRTPLTWVGISA